MTRLRNTSESNKNPQKENFSLAGKAAIAAVALVAGHGLSNSMHSSELRPNASTEVFAEEIAKKTAKAIEDTLNTPNKGKEYENAPVLTGLSFAINPENMEQLGIERIYTPLVLSRHDVGYIDINQETGEADVVIVDMDAGEFCDEFGNPITISFGESDPVGQFGLVLTRLGENGSIVAALTDKVGTFVGQTVPHFPEASL